MPGSRPSGVATPRSPGTGAAPPRPAGQRCGRCTHRSSLVVMSRTHRSSCPAHRGRHVPHTQVMFRTHTGRHVPHTQVVMFRTHTGRHVPHPQVVIAPHTRTSCPEHTGWFPPPPPPPPYTQVVMYYTMLTCPSSPHMSPCPSHLLPRSS